MLLPSLLCFPLRRKPSHREVQSQEVRKSLTPSLINHHKHREHHRTTVTLSNSDCLRFEGTGGPPSSARSRANPITALTILSDGQSWYLLLFIILSLIKRHQATILNHLTSTLLSGISSPGCNPTAFRGARLGILAPELELGRCSLPRSGHGCSTYGQRTQIVHGPFNINTSRVSRRAGSSVLTSCLPGYSSNRCCRALNVCLWLVRIKVASITNTRP